MTAALSGVLRVVSEMQKCVVVLACDQHDIAAASAVASAGSASRHILFPSERETAVTAVAGFHPDSYFINEHAELMDARN
jgi:hypothetical protein